ncbi:nitroreductase [Streptomyces sioyaensis]|uniref:nitroreductase family protein n=1 Tax=Streptomyces sioyaensis TaxID=67364 RepID=UPI0033ED9863
MNVTQAISTRRSVKRLTDPAPADDEVISLVETAANAPDHGLLRPWRLILVRGGARDALGDACARAASGTPDAQERARAKPLRAPLLVSIVFCPQQHEKVPEWEQLAATAAMVHALELLLHDRGWGVIWRTGAGLDAPQIRQLLGLPVEERLLGWLYVGTPLPAGGRVSRPPIDVGTKVSVLSGA